MAMKVQPTAGAETMDGCNIATHSVQYAITQAPVTETIVLRIEASKQNDKEKRLHRAEEKWERKREKRKGRGKQASHIR